MLCVMLRALGAVICALALVSVSYAVAQDQSKAQVVAQLGHARTVRTMALSSDGRLALSTGTMDDTTFKLWDVASGKSLRTFRGHTMHVNAVAFSPDGRFALSGSDDHTMRLWDVSTGKELRRFTTRRMPIGRGWDRVLSVAFSPDGRFALAGGDLTLWDVNAGTELREFQGHTGSVTSVAFSPDGLLVLSGSSDHSLKLWEVTTGKEIRSFQGHEQHVTSVVFSPDGRLALSGSADGTVRLWDVATGRTIRSFVFDAERRGTSGRYMNDVTSVAFSSDGRSVLAAGANNTPKIWEVAAGTKPRSFKRHQANGGYIPAIRVANFSKDGRFVLSSKGSGLALWDVATLSEIPRFKQYGIWVDKVEFSPDGSQFVIHSGAPDVWSGITGRRLSVHSASGNIAFSPDHRLVLLSSMNELRLVEAASGKEIRRFETNRSNPFTALAFSADGRLALSGEDGTVRLWDVETGRELRNFSSPGSGARGVAFSPNGRLIVAAGLDRGQLKLWETAGREIGSYDASSSSENSTAFSPDSQLLLFPDGDRGVILVETATGKELRKFGDGMNQKIVLSADWRFALSFDLSSLRLWDVASGRELPRSWLHESVLGFLSAAAFSPDGRFVLSASSDGTMKLWIVATGAMLHTFTGHTDDVTSVAFSPDGRFALSGSRDGTARLWRTDARREVALMISDRDEWATVTAEGFFTSSHRDTDMLAISHGLTTATIGQIHQSLFNPDLVREALAGDPSGEVNRAAQVVNMEKVIDAGPPPEIKMMAPALRSRSKDELAKVTARVTDRGNGIGRIEWRINGITAAVMSPPAGNGPNFDVKQTLPLDPGENTVEVIAYERRNVLASLPARATISFDGAADKIKPTLHVLAIGINAYTDRGWTPPGGVQPIGFPPLGLAVNDAKTFAAKMQGAGNGLYRDVRVTLALNSDASKAGLEKIVKKLAAEIHPRDTFVFFAAAHGVSQEGRFYLIPQDYQGGTNPKALIERAIGQDDIQDWIANRIKAKKGLILLDTCESGALVSGYIRSRVDLPASEAAVGRLHEATGRPVLTAAASGKPAWEGYKGHGVFTYALMDALHRGDSSANGVIELSELVAHVQAAVPKISAEVQGLSSEKGIVVIAARGLNGDKQSAHFGSTGEDFGLVNRLP
jgi:WD40 repeat protein